MNKIEIRPIINVLWTGGLDSTYRICQLSFEKVIIQPYYIDASRKSTQKELQAIKHITALINDLKSTKAILKEVIIIPLGTITENITTENSWKQLNDKYNIGSQYEFLARASDQLNVKWELGLESSNRSKAVMCIKGEAVLKSQSYSNEVLDEPFIIKALIPVDKLSYLSHKYALQYYFIDKQKSSKLIQPLFENIHIPCFLFSITKEQEVELLRYWGMEKIMKQTWFCHKPVLGLPCGMCNPCKDALNEGMRWRVPVYGRILGRFRFICNIPARVVKKLNNIILK